jgi:mannan endo-1,4-beta-mannosidase
MKMMFPRSRNPGVRSFFMHRIGLVISVLTVGLLGSLSHAIEPANRNLIPEARAVLDYLASVEGKCTLAGVSGSKNAEAIKEVSGKYPAVLALDLSGWNSPPWGDSYNGVVQNSVDRAKAWWQDGGIVAMQLHWIHPSNPNGSAWRGKHGRKEASGPFDFSAALKPGTETHRELMRDLKGHADFLQQLADARVPVLWRPLHEIDGGWFWWTDGEHPENTAALWRVMFDYFVKQRKLNNLIWVYNAGLKPPKGRDVAQIEVRKRFYPGDAYVDVSGIDIYPNSWYGWKDYREDTYAKAYQIMKQVSPNKILALAEGAGIPNPDMLAKGGPAWIYCLAWWGPGEKHPEEWIRHTYNHDFVITRDELPAWK